MKMGHLLMAGAAALAAIPSAASAAITWTDWTQAGAGVAVGTVGGVGVTYTGDLVSPTRVNGPGTQYWLPFPSGDGPATGPDPLDILATSASGMKTINFGRTVTDVYLALNSWNGQTATFSAPFSVYVDGCGFWGCGTAVVSNGNTTVFGNGELHGILKFSGSFNSLTYTDTFDEYWHGIQVGIGAVPEPSTWALLILGFGVVGGSLRQRRRTSLAIA